MATKDITIAIGHYPDGFAKALAILGTDVAVAYGYAFIGRNAKSAVIILRAIQKASFPNYFRMRYHCRCRINAATESMRPIRRRFLHPCK